MKRNFLSIVLVVLAVVVIFALSWAMTSGIVWIIFKLLDMKFSFKIATAIWLALTLLSSFVRSANNQNK